MQRVAGSRSAIQSSTSSVRLFSTPPPAKPVRKPLAKWGDVVIPSPEEVNALKAKHQTDINYLKFENENTLAARLARPTIDITLARQQAQAKKEQESPSVTAISEAAPKAASKPEPTIPIATTIELMINQRREERQKRESTRLALKQQEEEERIAREEREAERKLNKKAKTHAAINEFRPLSEQIASPKPADPDVAERRARIVQLASELAAKRKAARLERELSGQNSPFKRAQTMKKPQTSNNTRRQSQVDEQEDFQLQLSEEGEFVNSGPEFTGPEKISNSLLEVYRPAAEIYKDTASLQSGRVPKGDYSAYLPDTLKSFGTPPDEVGAIELSRMTLSHRRDVSLPSRIHTINLVAGALKPKSKSAPKAAARA